MPTARRDWRVAIAALSVYAVACGQKGPPLAPLRPIPNAVTEVTARRIANQIQLRFVLPTTNATGPGPLELDRVEVYAITAAPGYTPPNRDLLAKAYLVGEVPVKPLPVEGQEPKAGDTRPEPGAAAFFIDDLTEAELTPVTPKTPPAPVPAVPVDAAATAAAAVAAAAVPVSKDPVRVYVARGVTKSGRPGPPSTRVQVPIVAAPAPPPDVAIQVTETGVTIQWIAPPGEPATTAYNIYRADSPLQPINPAALTVPTFEYTGAKLGEQVCFNVRSVRVATAASIEGELSEQECVTPQDTFPPAPPKRPDAVATAGQISLIWDPNTEKDLAGYIVLRGEDPAGPLQAITPAPIKETSYRDTTVTPGTRYVYAIVAVDNATPPNSSKPSPHVEEIAR